MDRGSLSDIRGTKPGCLLLRAGRGPKLLPPRLVAFILPLPKAASEGDATKLEEAGREPWLAHILPRVAGVRESGAVT